MHPLEVTMTTHKPVAPVPSAEDPARIVERPDGFYWQDKLTEKLYGPFATRLEAVRDMEGQNDSGFEEGESLEDAEQEIGISTWIDPETGEPAEEVLPRLNDD
jgi:hypothetical protein